MAKKDLFAEALADAKRIRQVAIENAKQALEESMTPKLQSMISAKLQEEMSEEDDLNESEDLDEILNLDENEESDTDMDDESNEDEPGGGEEELKDETPAEEVKVSDLTVDELKQIILDTVGQASTSSDIEIDDMSSEDEMDTDAQIDDETSMDDDEEINLDELMNDLNSINENEEELDESKVKGTSHQKGGTYKLTPGFKKVGKSMNESKEIVRLKKELHEINLLNAKSLHINKLFVGNNLNESQKFKILDKFENLKSVKEVEMMYESLKNNLKKPTSTVKRQIKESLGFASKSVASSKVKSNIIEDSAIARMKKLAGL